MAVSQWSSIGVSERYVKSGVFGSSDACRCEQGTWGHPDRGESNGESRQVYLTGSEKGFGVLGSGAIVWHGTRPYNVLVGAPACRCKPWLNIFPQDDLFAHLLALHRREPDRQEAEQQAPSP